MLMGISDNPVHTRHLGNFLRCTLGVAAGYQNAAVWVFPMDMTDRSASVLVGSSGDSAGIQDNHVSGVLSRGGLQTPATQLLFNGSAIRLSSPTTEVLDIVSSHGCYYRRRTSDCRSEVTVFRSRFVAVRPQGDFMKRRILLVDDELPILLTLKAVLEINGFDVTTAASAREAMEKLKAGVYQMVITDMRMESENAGYDVIRVAKEQSYKPATAILTAYPSLGSDWQSKGAQSLLVKPLGTDDLLRQIEVLLIQHEDKKSDASERAIAARTEAANHCVARSKRAV